MSFNILDTVIPYLSVDDVLNEEMTQIICRPLQMTPTQYHGSNACYETLNYLCNQAVNGGYTDANVNTLISAADTCQAWFYPTASAIYECAGYEIVTGIDTSNAQFINSVNGNYNSNDANVKSISSGSGYAITGVTPLYTTFYFANTTDPIVAKAPTNYAELKEAVKVCEPPYLDKVIYQSANLCSDSAMYTPVESQDYSFICIGAILSASPAWPMLEIG